VFGDPWIAANNMASCCVCRTGSGESHDWARYNR
jgi:hypothetical protein